MGSDSHEAIRPMRTLGVEVMTDTTEHLYDRPLSPEEEAAFTQNLTAIAEAERLGALEGDGTILG